MKKYFFYLLLFSVLLIAGCSSQIETHIVSFEANGGIYVGGGQLSQQIIDGESAVTPIFERYGYELIGWTYNFDHVYSDLNIMPIWQKIIFSGTEIYEIASPGTVEITTYDKYENEISLGSGFFRNEKGEIITNYHVIDGAYSAKVKMKNGEVFDLISVIGYSILLDIAIIKINYSTSLFLKESLRIPKTGDTVFALGSSLGFSDTFSSGAISNISREIDGVFYYQITAPISPGNSGGPLINEYGEVIGINTAVIPSGENIGFAIKMSEVLKVDCSTPKTLMEIYEENYVPYPYEKMSSETEPNSFLSSPNNVINGYTYSGELSSKFDTDFYKMNLLGKATLSIVLFSYYEVDIDYFLVSLRNSLGEAIATGQFYEIEGYTIIMIDFSFYYSQTIYIGLSLSSSYPYSEGAPYDVFIYADYE
ncbi:MAG: S1C family serine protease [Bacilli bacterium]